MEQIFYIFGNFVTHDKTQKYGIYEVIKVCKS